MKEVKEQNVHIANRVPPGDQWTLLDDRKKIVHKTMTDTLESYYQSSRHKGEFRLNPIEGKLYAIKTFEEEVIPIAPKTFNIYGE